MCQRKLYHWKCKQQDLNMHHMPSWKICPICMTVTPKATKRHFCYVVVSDVINNLAAKLAISSSCLGMYCSCWCTITYHCFDTDFSVWCLNINLWTFLKSVNHNESKIIKVAPTDWRLKRGSFNLDQLQLVTSQRVLGIQFCHIFIRMQFHWNWLWHILAPTWLSEHFLSKA